MNHFELELTISADRDHNLRVTGSIDDYFPPSYRGHPDTWAPAEGGGINDLTVYVVSKRGRERQVKKLSDSYNESIEREICRILKD